MAKLELTDTILSAMVKMSDGNPGAVAAIADILEKHKEIDPQAFMGGMGVLLTFDDMGLYGTDIYILYSDKCGRDVRRLIMLLRSSQLGFLPQQKIIDMGKDQERKINLSEGEFKVLDDKVCEMLEDFKKAA